MAPHDSKWRDGAFGGSDAAASYRRYVTAGIAEPPPSPWREAQHGWVLGSTAFLERLGEIVRADPRRERRRESRLRQGIELQRICEVVCASYGLSLAELSHRGSRHEARAAFAYLARQHTEATNAKLAELLGVSRPDCVPNLTRRFARWMADRQEVRARLRRLEEELHRASSRKKA